MSNLRILSGGDKLIRQSGQTKKARTFKTEIPCICCGHDQENENCFHHLLTRKVYQEFEHEHWNMIPVCRKCHNEFHTKGTAFMAMKYPSVKSWLDGKGWSICPVSGKYKPEGF